MGVHLQRTQQGAAEVQRQQGVQDLHRVLLKYEAVRQVSSVYADLRQETKSV